MLWCYLEQCGTHLETLSHWPNNDTNTKQLRHLWRLNSCGTCGGYTSPHLGLDACSENCRGWKRSFCVRMCMCACVLVCSVETNINKLLHIRVEELVKLQPLRWPIIPKPQSRGFWRNSLIVTTIWPRLRLPNSLPRFLHHFDSTHHHTLWKGAALRFRNMIYIVFIFNIAFMSAATAWIHTLRSHNIGFSGKLPATTVSVSCLAPPKMEGQDPPKTFQATMRPFNAFTAWSVSLLILALDSCWGISIASWDCPMGISVHCTWELNKNLRIYNSRYSFVLSTCVYESCIITHESLSNHPANSSHISI